MKTLTTAIYAKCAVGTSLYTAIGGRLYKARAPQGAAFPYVVFFVVSDVPMDTFTEALEDVLVQFSCFSTSPSSSEIEDIYEYLKALYDGCTLTMTGQTLLSMERQNATLIVEDQPTPTGTMEVWHYAVDYRIRLKVG